MAIGSVLAPLVGAGISYIGGQKADEQRRKEAEAADRIRREALARLDALDIPEQQKLQLEDSIYQGDVSTELQKLQYQSAMEGVSADPRFQQAQLDALSKLGELSEGGMNEADKLALQQMQNQQAMEDRGRQQAIIQNMAERGAGGSGQEAAARLLAQQSGANASAMQGAQINADAQSRALNALMARGDMGGQMRDQSFGEQSNIAKARDVASQFNSDLLSRGVMRDVGEKQRIADLRAGNRREETRYNTEAGQRDYENKFRKASGQNAGYTSYADAQDKAGEAAAGRTAAGYGAVAKGISAGIDAWAKDKDKD